MSKPRIYRDVVQGSTAWLNLRLGVPTASQFHRIITPGGKPSKSQEPYRFELIAEKLTGDPTAAFISTWMNRGSEEEENALAFYEFTRDCKAEKVGFIRNGDVGASPDFLIGTNGMAEIKVCKPGVHVGYLLQEGTAYEEHVIQAQSQLWIAEREFNDLVAFNPKLPPAIHRANRDEFFIAQLRKEVGIFCEKLAELWSICVSRGYVAQAQEQRQTASDDWSKPLPSPQDAMKELLRGSK